MKPERWWERGEEMNGWSEDRWSLRHRNPLPSYHPLNHMQGLGDDDMCGRLTEGRSPEGHPMKCGELTEERSDEGPEGVLPTE